MNISILTCPQCNAMVLSDAARCHVCDHVLDDGSGTAEEAVILPTDHAVAEDLETCTGCGETYRRGLVRCWNCGAFTRKEIQEAYSRMTSDPARYAVSEFRESSETQLAPEATRRAGPWRVSAAAADDAKTSTSKDDEATAEDEDFDFELAESVQLTDAMERAAEEEEPETYGLATAPGETEGGDLPPVLATSQAVEPEAAAIPSLVDAAAAPVAEQLSHKDATAGDVLLEIARQEEADIQKTRKTYTEKIRGGFVVYCPMGCRIRVQERHRGKAGKCPKCEAVFFVPRKKARPKATETQPGEAAAVAAVVEKWRGYLVDVHLHNVIPQKLRIKPDSLLNDFGAVDAVFSDEGMLLITLVTAPGFLGANLKKKPMIRTAVQEHLKVPGTVDGLPAPQSRLIGKDMLKQLAVAQPSPADVESLFGNIPVFGAGRIAVRLPRIADDQATQYLSFTLSEFRAFAAALDEVCGIAGLGADTEIPLSETYNTVTCHYSEEPVRELLGVEYYQKDPQIKLKIAGWRCGGCALVVSEDSRKKEKIGGLNGKSIGSAKCPKCKAKFGSHPLYEVEGVPAVQSAVESATAGS